jgi:hypothetical protein
VETVAQTTVRYVVLGFEHIFPGGWDHVFFVLGLFFLEVRFRELFLQTTAFTLGHATTLALCAVGMINPAPGVVEPGIAFSIAFVALENLLRTSLSPTRLLVIFSFGLLHGMGFAGALKEAGFPKETFLLALISFNVGVDLAQLAVLGIAFLAIAPFRRYPWYSSYLRTPACLCIGGIGLMWGGLRLFSP